MTQRTGTAANTVSKGHARYIFLLLFLLYAFDYIDRLVVVSMFPFIQKEWGISDTQCGMLISAVYWSLLIFSVPVSILVDRWSRKKSIGIMSMFWGFATLACAYTTNFWQLFVTRTAIGIGEAGYAPGGTAMISTLFPQEKRARMLGLWNASIPLGSALGMVIGGYVAQHYGWRHAFGIVAIPGMIIALLFFFVKDYKTVDLVEHTGEPGRTAAKKMRVLDVMRHFAKNPTLLFNNFGFAASVLVTTGLLSWLPTYFHRTQGIDMTSAGTKAGSIMIMSMIGAPLVGWLTDLWQKKRANARMLTPAVTSVAAAILLFAAINFFEGSAQYAVFLVAGVACAGFIPGSVAVTQDVVHPGLRAMSLSLNVVIQHMFGSSIAPVVVGAVSDAHGIQAGLMVLPGAAMVGALLYFIGSFFYIAARARTQKLEQALNI